jgi:DNA-binding transcriptional MerR regulator
MIVDFQNDRRIFRSDGFDMRFPTFKQEPVYMELIHKKEFSIGTNPDASYRVTNHWEKLGIIPSDRKDGQGWRKFSLYDLVWQMMVLSLRDFGFPNDKILKVKDSLLDLKYPNGEPYPLFEYYLSMAIEFRKPIFAIIHSDGYADIAEFEEIQFTQEAGYLRENHIRIDINKIIGKLFESKDLAPLYDLLVPITNNEAKIFNAVRSGKHQSINVELSSNAEDTEKIKRIRTITHRKLREGENLNKLVKMPNQKTNIFSNENGDIGLQIDEEVR